MMRGLTITKGGEVISTTTTGEPLVLRPDPRWLGVEGVDCYYFPQLKLEPPIVWQVMAGSAMGKFLDHCNFEFEDGTKIEDLRYAHGRSEVMRGRQYVSTVLLVQVRFTEPIVNSQWVTYLPSIYEEFMRNYDASQKRS